jgi:predicted RecB family nuclease
MRRRLALLSLSRWSRFLNHRGTDVAQRRPEGGIMTTKITLDTIKSYLSCKYKGHLKLAGECGAKSDYEAMTAAEDQASREEAIAKLAARVGEGNARRGTAVTTAALKLRTTLITDASFDDDAMSLRFDGLKLVDGASGLGDHHYLPVLHAHGVKVGRQQKLLLAMLGLVLARVQGPRPATGLVARGSEGRLGKVRLDAKLYRHAGQVLDELNRLQAGAEPPKLTLNRHCQVCEFRQRCRKQAEQADDLSLLRGMSEQEIGSLNSKGIFTVRQLSYTFRVRRRNKRAKRQSSPRSFALQALAIRENKIHVHGSYAVPSSPTSIYLDIEGLP